MSGTVAHAYHSSAGETQAGGSLGSDIQCSLFGKLRLMKNLVSKVVDGIAGMTSETVLCLPHTQVSMLPHEHTRMHEQNVCLKCLREGY